MAKPTETQTDLFGTRDVKFEYYPVLLPNEATLVEFAALNTWLVKYGIKPSNQQICFIFLLMA